MRRPGISRCSTKSNPTPPTIVSTTRTSMPRAISGSARWTITKRTRPARSISSPTPACSDADYCITNGPACSPDGRTLYHTDTLQKVIYAFDRTRDGELSNRRVFARMGAGDGYPDGPIADSQGVLWSGLYGGGGVNQYAP